MDIDLLARMVREVILDNDSVTLPGVGSFVADLVPSSFSDKGYTIHPPYRRLYFSPRQGEDTLLSDLYASSNDVDRETATRILVDFLSEMKEVLKVRKTIVFPGLGRLRATRENHFFFVADEDLDIYPAGFGLGPISLKTHVETPDEVASAVAGLAELMEQPAPAEPVVEEPAPEPVVEELIPEPVVEEPVPEPVVEEPIPEPVVEEPDPEPVVEAPAPQPAHVHHHHHSSHPKKRSLRKVLWWVFLAVLIVVVVAMLLFILLGHVAPQWIDPLLYSPEELEILRY